MYGNVYGYGYPEASQPTRAQLLAQNLHNWWWTRGHYSVHTSAWAYPPLRPATHQEQVLAIAAELAQDAGLAQIELCTFLGTPEGKLIATAVEAAIPEPYRLVVQEALNLICQQRGSGRQAVLGLGAIAAVVLIALTAGK